MCLEYMDGNHWADCGWCQRLDCGWHPNNYKVDHHPSIDDPLKKQEEIETAWNDHLNS
jgi:hypothetical protein